MVDQPVTTKLWEPDSVDSRTVGPVRVADDGTVYMLNNDETDVTAPIPDQIYEMDVYQGPDAPVSPNSGPSFKSSVLTLTGSHRPSLGYTTGLFGMGDTFSTMSASAVDYAGGFPDGALIFDSGGLLLDASALWNQAAGGGTVAVRSVDHNGTTWYSASQQGTGDPVISTTPGGAPTGNNMETSGPFVFDWVSDGTYIWSVGGPSGLNLCRWDPDTDTVDTYNIVTGGQAFRAIGYGLICGVPYLMAMRSSSSISNRCYLIDPSDPDGLPFNAIAFDLDPWSTIGSGDGPLSIDYDPVWDRWIASVSTSLGHGIWQIKFQCCVPIHPDPLFIPYKTRLQDEPTTGPEVSAEHQFDNWKTIERWAHNWMVDAGSADRCDLFIPYKEHAREPEEVSAEQSFDNWKVIERWAHSISDGDCGCSCVGAADPPDKCRLFVPYKDHLIGVSPDDTSAMNRAAEQEFDNFKTLERWAFRYSSGTCGCTT